MLLVFVYGYWFPTCFPYGMMFMSFNNNTMGITSGAETVLPFKAPESTPAF